MRPTTVAAVLVDGLKRAGAARLFAVEGAPSCAEVLDAARAGDLPVVLAGSGQGAVVMAAVTGELTGAPGVALADADGDVRDAAAAAFVDRSPLIIMTGSLPSQNSVGVKASLAVTAESAAHWIAHGVRLAVTEPRGPVVLAVAEGMAARPAVPVATDCRPGPLPAPDPGRLDDAARAIGGASRPLLIAGMGARGAETAAWLRAFAEALPAAVLVTPKAKGTLPDPHPLALGVLGGAAAEAALRSRADLIVAIGLDAGEIPAPGWRFAAPVVHLGPSPAASEHLRPTVEIVGDIAAILAELAPRLHGRARADWDVAELDRLKRGPAPGPTSERAWPAPARVIALAREVTPPDTLAAVEHGPLRAAALAHWPAVAPGEFLISNADRAGFALPAALAARLVHPRRPVLCFTDARGLAAARAELATAARLGPGVVVIAVDARPGTGNGVSTVAADSEGAFGAALRRALAAGAATLVDVRTASEPV